MPFEAEFTRADGTTDRHIFKSCLEYANYIAKENMAHGGDGKYIIGSTGALVTKESEVEDNGQTGKSGQGI